MLRFKPDFVVVGAPKCGTTSLYYYLKQHPEIYLPGLKELHYFSAAKLKENTGGPGDKQVIRRVCEAEQDYERHFASAPEKSVKGEFSPSYFVYPETAEAIKKACGAIKILIMLRNPADKVFSQYCHLLKENRETLSFEKALAREGERADQGWNDFWRFTWGSYYCERVKEFVRIFGRDKVKIILLEQFAIESSEVLHDLCNFLNIDPDFSFSIKTKFNPSGRPHSKLFSHILTMQNPLRRLLGKFLSEGFKQDLYNRLMDINTGKKPEFKEKTRRNLEARFRDDIICLENFLGLDTEWLKN